MKFNILGIIGIAAILSSCITNEATVVKNVKLEKAEQGKEYDHYAVSYALPQTIIKVKVVAEKTVTKPGPFAAYAERFLGLTSVPARETSEWKIKSVALSTSSQRDPGQVYRISSEGASRANRIQLSPQGVLLGVNMPPYKAATYDLTRIGLNEAGDMVIPGYPDLTIRKHTEPMPDTVYQYFRTDTSFIRLPILKDIVSTKTIMNQAEEAANIIMQLRERKYWLINGEVGFDLELAPMPEGKALDIMIKELDQMEHDYVSLFVGRTMKEIKEYEFSYIPVNRNGENADLFTFSTFSGVLPAGNSNGDPVRLEINANTEFPGQQDRVTAGENSSSISGSGLAHRLPGQAKVSVVHEATELVSESLLIAQYGIIQFLPKRLLQEPDVMIRIHPDLGSIEGIYEK